MRRLTLVVLVLVIAGGGYVAYDSFAGGAEIERPSYGWVDYGDWGEVSEERTEIVTTLWVDNPNPAGVAIGDALTISYDARLNGVRLAEGEKRGFDIANGNNTVQVSTYLLNDRIAPWWVAFIRNNETITYRADSEVELAAGVNYVHELPQQNGTLLDDRTPIITSVNRALDGADGEYTQSVSTDDLTESERAALAESGVLNRDEVTVGYAVTDATARWGEVTEARTNLIVELTVRNAGDVPEPTLPESVAAEIALNDVRLLDATGDAFTVRDRGGDRTLAPGETQTIVYVVTMDNERVDEWFTSFARRGERSSVDVRFQFRFGVESPETIFRVPADGGVRYTCAFQTGILVDEQETSTTCGSDGTLHVGPASVDRETVTPTATATATTTATPTATETPTGTATSTAAPETVATPTAVAVASPQSGNAPLTVEFDGGDSTDPDDDIVEYVWRFDDGTPPVRGQTVDHTFGVPGTYVVELTVVDSQGNRDTDTVEITVG
jgi:LEA14-like dessication related protein